MTLARSLILPVILLFAGFISQELFALRLEGGGVWIAAALVAAVTGLADAALAKSDKTHFGAAAGSLAAISLLLIVRTEGPSVALGWLGMTPTHICRLPVFAMPLAGVLGRQFVVRTRAVTAPTDARQASVPDAHR